MEIKITPPVIDATLGVANEVEQAAKPQAAPVPAEAPADAPLASAGSKIAEWALQAAAAKASIGARMTGTVQTPYSHVDGPAGAYYRKVESIAKENARGIEARVVLPEPHFDTDPKRWRMEVKDSPWKEGPRDRPSVYLGGHSGDREVDAGLTWDRVYAADGAPTWTTDPNGWTRDQANVFTRDLKGNFVNASTGEPATAGQIASMKPNCAFRPYVRTSNVQQSDLTGLNDEEKEKKKGEDWHSPRRDSSQADRPANVYFYPGDRVTMKFGVRSTTKDDKRNIELSISTQDGTNRNYTGVYKQANWPGDKASFKRVNSLDQVGAEKDKQVASTKTTVNGCLWESVSVKDKNGNSVPLTSQNGKEVRGSDTAKHYKDVFKFRTGSFDKHGSEYVDINPAANK